ncbi:RluA family pseudouridine synthase [Cytophagaceae bacterium AH-315-L13]|nr:RluA family pseudouridine synthase [Cytophagaceae bacterium AH-315-L13]
MDENKEHILEEREELYEHHRFEVDKGQQPLRIDKFLVNRIENATRNKIQNAAKAGNILVNKNAIKSNYKVRPNDIISIVLPHPPRDTEIYPEDIPLNIVYEDDDILIVNKETGMVVHPGHNNYSGTLVNALVHHFGNLPMNQQEVPRPGLVHRIDKDTSGLLVVAKNELAMTHLAKQFFDHSIERKYRALVWGDIENDEGTVNEFIGRSIKDRRVMQVYTDGEQGKNATTHYKVIERFHYVTLIECQLETGRTHQIRIHMKHLGHPLFNDVAYGGNRIVKGTTFTKYKQFIDNCFKLLPGQALHAYSLGFVHPISQKEVYFESELPDSFQEIVEKWRRYSIGD